MKKITNLIKSFLRKGKPLPHEHGPASKYFQDKVKSMKIELLAEKSGCGCGSTCKCAKSSEKLDVFKAELKKPTPKPVAKKPVTPAKPVAKKPAPKKPKAE
jgi:hypothetical protein